MRRGLLGLGQGGPRGAANGCLFCPEDPAVRGRLTECLEAILNKAQEPPKSKKVQHSNAKNAVLFEAISLVTHHDRWAPLSLPPPHGHAPRQVGRAQPPPSTWSCTTTGGPRSASPLHTQLGADRWAALSLHAPHTAGCCGPRAQPGHPPRQVGRAQPPPSTHSWVPCSRLPRGLPLLLGIPPSQPLPGPPRNPCERVSHGLRGSRLWQEGVCGPRWVGWGCLQVPAGAPTRVPWFHGLGTVSQLPCWGVHQSRLCRKGADVTRTE